MSLLLNIVFVLVLCVKCEWGAKLGFDFDGYW